MPFDFVATFEDYFADCEECWDSEGFWPKRKPDFELTPIVVYGASACYRYFITNGLLGLLECEYGKMYPEFSRCCRFFGCMETEKVYQLVMAEFSSGVFERNDLIRGKIVNDGKRQHLLHDKYSEVLDSSLEQDLFLQKLTSFCQFTCDRLNLSLKKVEYELPSQDGVAEFDWTEKKVEND